MNIRNKQLPICRKSMPNTNELLEGRDAETASLSPNMFDAPMPLVYNRHGASIDIDDLALRVAHLDDVLLHEHTERQRVEKLVERIQADQFLKNPPIVVRGDSKYILLDGATRVTALKQLGYRDVVVQVVDYDMPGLALETWNHLLIGLPVSDFLTALRQLNGLQIQETTADQASHALVHRHSVGTIALADGSVFSLRATGAESLATQVTLLNDVVAAYEGRVELLRIADEDVDELPSRRSPWDALIVFPRYRPNDIRALALNGHKLPTGITRHIIPGRAMRINLPLTFLRGDESLEKKNEWLAEWMRAKMRERRVRYYREPVYLFDE